MDAREYLQQVQSLCNSFDPEALLRANDAPIDNALEALKKMRLELKSFLPYVFETRDDPKTQALRKLDCTSIKICGLYLTQKALRDLKPEQLDLLIQRTETASRNLLHIISANDDIDKVVRLCNVEGEDYEQFMTDHKKVRRLGKGSVELAAQYSLAGRPCWCFTGVSQKAIHSSFAMPSARAVRDITTFLPVDESFDCIIRMTVGFDTASENTFRSPSASTYHGR
ncbi:hypothetical protein A1F97_09859 [Pyrenophora tritici-repentis]|nr:hypothetical protein PtrSN001C_010175 [Pyrenophora tritici-repentis]PZD31395.1 hypothetical protein A1F97_09859 [Pyrenophora tritici-repentis]